jgi:Isopenicillin N synthase and related dioxygenases
MNVRKVNYKDENAPREFTRSLRQTGFSVLTDHPIDMSLIETVYSEWAAFFGSNKKDKYLFDPTKQDGYFPFLTENAKGQSIKDLKELFHIYSWGRYPEE